MKRGTKRRASIVLHPSGAKIYKDFPPKVLGAAVVRKLYQERHLLTEAARVQAWFSLRFSIQPEAVREVSFLSIHIFVKTWNPKFISPYLLPRLAILQHLRLPGVDPGADADAAPSPTWSRPRRRRRRRNGIGNGLAG